MSPIEGGRKKGRMLHAEAKKLGQASRTHKNQLEREIRSRERRIVELEDRATETRELIESGLQTRSWKLAHRLMRIGRKLSGQRTGEASSFARAAEVLAAGEAARTPVDDAFTYVFVSGCARSGTSATVDLLNNDPRVAIGQERYKYLRGKLRKHHFLPEYFLNPSSDETNILGPDRYRALREKWAQGRISVVGDKIRVRNNLEALEGLIDELGDVRFVYMLRELPGVASSYNRRAAKETDVNWPANYDYRKAVEDWNSNLRALREMHDAGLGDQVLVVRYERLYSDEPGQVKRLVEFTGLDSSPQIEKGRRRARRKRPELRRGEDLDAEMLRHLEEHSESELYRWADSLAASP